MMLEIPLHITPSFVARSLCELSWSLQFEFVVTGKKILGKSMEEGSSDATAAAVTAAAVSMANSDDPSAEEYGPPHQEWCGPRQVPVQTLVWNLPVKIVPCDPCHVELSVKTRSQFRFALKQVNNV